MKILLAQKLSYFPALTGAGKSNRALLQSLSHRGHSCRVLALAANTRAGSSGAICESWAHEQVNARTEGSNAQGVQVHQLTDPSEFSSRLLEEVEEFGPDWLLISEDPSYFALAAALESMPGRVVFLSHSQATLPFGPECFGPDSLKTEMLSRVAGIIAVSNYLNTYIQKWGALNSVAIALPAYGDPPFPHVGSWDNPFVTIINPSAIKGISIFLALARALPAVRFAAVPTWATSAADEIALKYLPNVDLLEPTEDIDQIFARTRILLVPSLWGEAFGKIVVEAMLRGIPVLASNVGGLPEAKLSVDYLLPVRPIKRYQKHRDDRLLPVPVVPDQDVEPWLDALERLLSDRAEYQRLSRASRDAAVRYVSALSIVPVETYLKSLPPTPALENKNPSERRGYSSLSLENLSQERLELLALRLRKTASRDIKQ